MMRRWALGVALAIVVGGCAHESYQPQAGALVVPPETYAETVAGVGPAPAVCEALASGPMEPFLSRVAASNLDLKGAAARLRRSQAVAAQARAGRFPRIDGAAEATRGTAAGASAALFFPGVGESITESYQGSMAASFELDAWSRVRAGAQAAALDADQAAELAAALRITVHAQALETWFSLVAQRRLIDLLQEQAAVSARFLELTRLRFGLGQTPAQDIGRQRQNLLAIQGQLAQAFEAASLLENRLAALAGAPALDVDVPRRLPTLPPSADPGLPAALAVRRPDVRAAMAGLAAADRRSAAAAAERLPRLVLSGSLLSVEQMLGELFSDTLWQAGLSASAPVFDSGASGARIDAAEAGAEEQLYAWGSTLLSALREVEDALVGNRRQAELLASLDAQLDEANRVLDLSREFYRSGQGDYLGVLTALQSQQALERQRLEAQRGQFVNRVTLCRALGVGPDKVATSASTAPTMQYGDTT